MTSFEVAPEDAGPRAPRGSSAPKGGEPAHNAAQMRDLLGGARAAARRRAAQQRRRARRRRKGRELARGRRDRGRGRSTAAPRDASSTGWSRRPTERGRWRRAHRDLRRKRGMSRAARTRPRSRAARPARRRRRRPAASRRRSKREVAAGYGLIARSRKPVAEPGADSRRFRPRGLARAYRAGGATCLSVLTDAPYFQGSDDDLPRRARRLRSAGAAQGFHPRPLSDRRKPRDRRRLHPADYGGARRFHGARSRCRRSPISGSTCWSRCMSRGELDRALSTSRSG